MNTMMQTSNFGNNPRIDIFDFYIHHLFENTHNVKFAYNLVMQNRTMRWNRGEGLKRVGLFYFG